MTLRDRSRWSVLPLAIAASLLCAGAAPAASLGVSPVILEFATGQKAITTTVTNSGDEPVQVQARLFKWSSAGDGETYEPTRDIGFSPPIFELKPGESQIVRLMLRVPAPVEREAAYRLIVDQLPKPDVPGVQMPVRMVMPVFVAPPSARRGDIQWAATADGEAAVITATNPGARRVKLLDLAITSAPGADPVKPGGAGYVLAGQTRTWRVPTKPGVQTLGVKARTESGPLDATVSLAPDR